MLVGFDVVKIKTLMHFNNGMCAAFDENGEQVPELQQSFYRLWIAHAKLLGFDVSETVVEDQIGRVEKLRELCPAE